MPNSRFWDLYERRVAEVWTRGNRSYDRLVGRVNLTERATGHTYEFGAAMITYGICKEWR